MRTSPQLIPYHWKKGQSGNPKGSPGAAAGATRTWNKIVDDKTRERLVQKLIDDALGDTKRSASALQILAGRILPAGIKHELDEIKLLAEIQKITEEIRVLNIAIDSIPELRQKVEILKQEQEQAPIEIMHEKEGDK